MKRLQDIGLKTMLQELVDMLEQVYGDKLKAVILYGSVARGEATSESDVDIMLLIDGDNQELRLFEDKLSDISTDLSIKYSKVLSIIDISYQEYIRWIEILPFYRNVSEEGVVLYTDTALNMKI
ncbi:MAG: nucleotidyltransferase domain-containing protein [Lachnospiraceae bacterium]|nr:nucleotidyltransferase domain-containing protein [Lachnospiraceae bacterium]